MPRRPKDPLERTITDALAPGGRFFITYHATWRFVDDVEAARGQITPLIKDRRQAGRAVDLLERLIAGCYEKSEEVDDSDGSFGQLVQDPFCDWIRARQAANATTTRPPSSSLPGGRTRTTGLRTRPSKAGTGPEGDALRGRGLGGLGRRRASGRRGRLIMGKKNKSCQQRQLRRRRGERAFIFDKGLSKCLGDVPREEWEDAISFEGGDVAGAAKLCGLAGVPKGAKALWGQSATEALATYRSWQKRKR